MSQPFIFARVSHTENFSIFDTKWIPGTAKFVAIGGYDKSTGCIKVFELNGSRLKVLYEVNKKTPLRCTSFGLSRTSQSYMSTGDFNGSLQVIDIERFDSDVYNVSNAHRGVINSIDAIGSKKGHGSSEIVTGGQDGSVHIWDPRQTNEPVVKIETDEEVRNASRDCWTVAFGNSYNNDERCVCAGFDNGDVKVFDLRNVQTCWETNVQNGVCHIQTQNKYCEISELAVSTTNGGLNIFKNVGDDFSQIPAVAMKNGDKLIENNQSHANTVWCVKHLPQNANILATCGGSGYVRLWQRSEIYQSKDSNKANGLKLAHELLVNNCGVNCFDWCPDYMGLAVCGSFDKRLRVIAAANLPVIS